MLSNIWFFSIGALVTDDLLSLSRNIYLNLFTKGLLVT